MASLDSFRTYLPSNALSDAYLQQVLDDAASLINIEVTDADYDKGHRAYAAHLLVSRGSIGIASSVGVGGVSKSYQRPEYKGGQDAYLMEYLGIIGGRNIDVVI